MDPYNVLGISRDASEDEIKKAYRNLSRRYHPDANINNPNKEQAEEKFKQVQQAYQQIMKEKELGASGYSGGYRSGYNQNPYGDFGNFGGWGFGGFGSYNGYGQRAQDAEDETTIHLKAAANYIQSGHYKEALNVLNGISSHNALWYYYSALANSGLGNNVTAKEHAQKAASMDPYNQNYAELVQRLQYGGSWYRTQRYPYGRTVTFGNSFCLKLCIAEMICNLCCGGGYCFGSAPRYHSGNPYYYYYGYSTPQDGGNNQNSNADHSKNTF